jgi:hypothetical protein
MAIISTDLYENFSIILWRKNLQPLAMRVVKYAHTTDEQFSEKLNNF